MKDGIILIDKPSAMTSFGVVARVRRVLSQAAGKKVKVGHCGTLDPFATGLLVLVTGKETKSAETFMKLDKVYEATIKLGHTSTTGDPEGDIVDTSDTVPSEEQVKRALETFVGQIEQVPPSFSAIKIDGQRAYKLARAGEVVEIPKRIVTIHSLELIAYAYPEVRIRTHVSSGTSAQWRKISVGRSVSGRIVPNCGVPRSLTGRSKTLRRSLILASSPRTCSDSTDMIE